MKGLEKVIVPCITLNYNDGSLESVRVYGELYKHEEPLVAENYVLNEEYKALFAENEKLRELCAGLWSVMWACAEQRCPHRHEDCFVVNGNGDGPKSNGDCWYERRMRELGIEVENDR
jgi:hypothetical protein